MTVFSYVFIFFDYFYVENFIFSWSLHTFFLEDTALFELVPWLPEQLVRARLLHCRKHLWPIHKAFGKRRLEIWAHIDMPM